MAEIKALFFKTAPHISARDSVARRYWGQVAALAPVTLVACFLGRADFLRVLLLCLVSAVAFELVGAKLFGKKDKLYHGEAILMAVLTAILMPAGCPPEMILSANFLAVFVAKELLGGMGEYVFHPVLFARVFLQAVFPGAMMEPMVLSGGPVTFAAAVAGGFMMMKQRQGYWETPLLYAGTSFFSVLAFGRWENPSWVFSNGILISAFFLLADPVAMPLTRKGTRFFAAGAALLGAAWGSRGFSVAAAGFAILFMNMLTPWLDLWLRPRPFKDPDLTNAGRVS